MPLWSFWEEVETPGIQTVPYDRLGGSRNTWDTDRTLGTGELNDAAVVILGGSRNTGDTDRTLGTGELNDTAVVILGGSRNTGDTDRTL